MSSQAAELFLIGVGGGGCRFASAAAANFGPGVQAIGFDSDAVASRTITAMRCQLLGAARYDGRSTGGDVVKGRTAVQDDEAIVRDALKGTRLAVVVTALGGGFGTGATPEILRILRQNGVHTLCVATLPFDFEGHAKTGTAQKAIPLLEEAADALVVLRLNDLYQGHLNQPLADAIVETEATLGDALMLLWSLLLSPGYIAIDAEHLLALIVQSGGRCRFAVASADSDERASECVSKLCRSPMLGERSTLNSVQAVVLGVLAGADLRLAELATISERLRSNLPPACGFNLGTVLDARFVGSLKLVALFFDVMRAPDDPVAAPGGELGSLTDMRPGKRGASKSKLLGTYGRFNSVEGTVLNGENLDTPTYQRMRLNLDR